MYHLLGLSPGLLRATARALLLALSVTTVGPLLHGAHDAEHRTVIVLHDESQHHFQAAGRGPDEAGEAEHCVACHFARASRGPVSWEPTGLNPLDSGRLLHHAHGRLVRALSATPTPARAPPAVA